MNLKISKKICAYLSISYRIRFLKGFSFIFTNLSSLKWFMIKENSEFYQHAFSHEILSTIFLCKISWYELQLCNCEYLVKTQNAISKIILTLWAFNLIFFASQALWRGRKIRRQYSEKIKKSARSSLNYYKKHISHIKLIQRAWRAKKAKIEFRKLLESNNVHR